MGSSYLLSLPQSDFSNQYQFYISLLNPEIVSEYVYLSLAQGQEAQGHQAYLSLA